MYEIDGLPRTAHIELKNGGVLEIKDQQVVNVFGLFEWLLEGIKNKHWDEILKRMIQCGFRFEAVITQCIRELRDRKKLCVSLGSLNYFGTPFEKKTWIPYKKEKAIVRHITEKLKSCKNWEQFHNEFAHSDKFVTDMVEKLAGGRV